MKSLVFVWLMFVYASLGFTQPMSVDADRFEMFQNQQRADFFGSVVVHREDMVMKADKMKVWYQEVDGSNELKAVDATGDVEITTPKNHGSADRATFSAGSKMLILTGNARVQGETSTLEGETIEYNTETEDIKVLKGKTDKQVHFKFEEVGK